MGSLELRRYARNTHSALCLFFHNQPQQLTEHPGFWVADSFNINTWMIASSMITGNGLAWWHAWLFVLVIS